MHTRPRVSVGMSSGVAGLDSAESQIISPPNVSKHSNPRSPSTAAQRSSPTLTSTEANYSHQLIDTLPAAVLAQKAHLLKIDLSSNSFVTFPVRTQSNLISFQNCRQCSTEGFESHHVILFRAGNVSVQSTLISFTRLQSLTIRWNQLTSLPPSLPVLHGLTELDCSFNKLQMVPDELTQLKKLKRLILNDNLIQTLPNRMERMTSLQVLNVNYNQLQHLPPSLCRCEALIELECMGNPLVTPSATAVFGGLDGILAALRPLDQMSLKMQQNPTSPFNRPPSQLPKSPTSPPTSPLASFLAANGSTTAVNSSSTSPPALAANGSSATAAIASAGVTNGGGPSAVALYRNVTSSLRNSGKNQMSSNLSRNSSSSSLPAVKNSSATQPTSASQPPSTTANSKPIAFSSPFTTPLLPSASTSTVSTSTSSSSSSSLKLGGVRVRDGVRTQASGTGAGVRPLTHGSTVSGTASLVSSATGSAANSVLPRGRGVQSMSRKVSRSQLTSQLYPKQYKSKWLTQKDEKEIESGLLGSSSAGASNSASPPVDSGSGDVEYVRQLMLARGNLSAFVHLSEELNPGLAEPPPALPADLESENEELDDEEARQQAEELFLAEVEGRFPWLQAPSDSLSAAARSFESRTKPKPPTVAVPSFPTLTPEIKAELESTVSKSFLCSITLELMTNPVVAADGHTYERSAMEKWLAKRDSSPLTGERLISKVLTPNHALRTMILEVVEEKLKQIKKKEVASNEPKNTEIATPSS